MTNLRPSLRLVRTQTLEVLRRKAAAAWLAKHDQARCAEAVELLRGIDTDWLLHEEADRIRAAIDVLLKGEGGGHRMSTLRARRMVQVLAFRASAGPIATWSGHQIEVYLDLISSADDARWHRARTAARRFKVVAAVAYIAPLYALLEVVGHGRPWRGLDRHIRRMDRRLDTACTACSRAGDHDFTALVSRTVTGIRDWVGQIAARLARG